jgi:uncharacterized protein DUF3558
MRINTSRRASVLALPVLACLLAACGGQTGSGSASSTNASTSSAPAVAVAHPKKVTGADECHQLVDASLVSQVTGLTATAQTGSGESVSCSFDLADKSGTDSGQVTVTLGQNHAGTNGTTTAISVGGNPAQQQRLSGLPSGQQGCTVFVTLNNESSLNTLTVVVGTFQSGPDTCATAQTLATDAFTKLASA